MVGNYWIRNIKRRDRVTCRASTVVYFVRTDVRGGVKWAEKGPVQGRGEEQAVYTGLISLR